MALLKSIQDFLGIGDDEGDDHAPVDSSDHDHSKHAKGGEKEKPATRPPPREEDELAEGGPRYRLALARIFEGLLQKLELIDHQLQGMARVEAAVGGMSGMVQFVAKGGEKRDRELRAHITTELDKLGATLRLDASKQGAVDVFKAVLPSLDDVDHVLKQEENKSLSMVQRKLKDAFAKLGIEEIAVEEGKTHFDSGLHDGEPYKGDEESAKSFEKGTILHVERAGYRTSGVLLRAAKVLVKG